MRRKFFAILSACIILLCACGTQTTAPSSSSFETAQTNAVVTAETETATKEETNGDTSITAADEKDLSAANVPLVNYEYGPMTVTSYSSNGRYWRSNSITSLVFTEIEPSPGGQYKISLNMQGITDSTHATISVYFYDANNRMLGQAKFLETVAENVEYNVFDYEYVESHIIENAVRIGFFSDSGQIAESGVDPAGQSTDASSDPESSAVAADEQVLPEVLLPEVDREYGPMTLTSIFSNEHWQSNAITSLVFTEVALESSGDYKISLKMQGIANYSSAEVYLYFFDADYELLDWICFCKDVEPNAAYNISVDAYVKPHIIENAVRMGFFSSTGDAATYGVSIPG